MLVNDLLAYDNARRSTMFQWTDKNRTRTLCGCGLTKYLA